MSKPIAMRAVARAPLNEARRGAVRIHPEVCALLGMRRGDVLALTGKRTSPVLVEVGVGELGRDALIVDDLVLANLCVEDGATITAAPVGTYDAKAVYVAPASGTSPGTQGESLRAALLGKVVAAGDVVSLRPRETERLAGEQHKQLLASMAREWGPDWQDGILHVSSVEPTGLVRVTPATDVRLGAAPGAAASPTPTPVDPLAATHVTLAASHLTPEAATGPAHGPPSWLAEPWATLHGWLNTGLHHADLLTRLGSRPSLGVLVTGPIGSGKSTLVGGVVESLRARIVALDGASLATRDDAQALADLDAALAAVRSTTPAVLVVSEVERLAPREDPGPLAALFRERITALLAEGRAGVVATSSRPELIDGALRRPGLLDLVVSLPLPTRDERVAILTEYAARMPVAREVSYADIAGRTPGFVAADLAALCRGAALHAAQRVLSGPRDATVANVLAVDFEAALQTAAPASLGNTKLEVAETSWDDVGGLEDVKRVLSENILWPLTRPESFARLGIDPPSGVLLHGPPGCGKTHIVKALAHDGAANFLAVRGAELLSKWVGESEAAVRELFRQARDAAPCLVFFDEVDALSPRRGGTVDSGATDRVVASLLTELDGITTRQEVYVVAATNRPDIIDPALLRPGRLDRLVEVPPPDASARAAVLKAITRRMPLTPDVDLAALGASCEGYSCADLEALAREAAMMAMRESSDAALVTAAHFAAARSVVLPTLATQPTTA